MKVYECIYQNIIYRWFYENFIRQLNKIKRFNRHEIIKKKINSVYNFLIHIKEMLNIWFKQVYQS